MLAEQRIGNRTDRAKEILTTAATVRSRAGKHRAMLAVNDAEPVAVCQKDIAKCLAAGDTGTGFGRRMMPASELGKRIGMRVAGDGLSSSTQYRQQQLRRRAMQATKSVSSR